MKIGTLEIKFGRIIIVIVIGLVLLLAMNFNSRLGILSRQQHQAATVRVEATGIILTQEVLLTQAAEATSPAAVDKYAREQAHLRQPEDNVLVILPVPGVTPTQTLIPTPRANNYTPWETWMLFIFGE